MISFEYQMKIMIISVLAYSVGWIGGSAAILQGILNAAIKLGVAFVIWLCFMRYYRLEARKMNDRIQEMK